LSTQDYSEFYLQELAYGVSIFGASPGSCLSFFKDSMLIRCLPPY